MKSKRLFPLMSVIVALSLAILACGGGAAATATPNPTRTPKPTIEAQPTDKPTKEPAATATKKAQPQATSDTSIVAGEVSVTSVYGYVDEYDYFHVVGLIYNDTENAVSSIELTLQLADGSGDTVLTDSDDEAVDEVTFSPLLYTLGQGETAPFDYYVSTDSADTKDWQGNVTVTDYSDTTVDRADVAVENTNLAVDKYGTIYLTGELVNESNEPVSVNGLAGVLLAEDGTALAADSSYNVARYLAAAGDAGGNDRSPFSISLDGPAPDADSRIFFVDVDKTDEIDTTADLTVSIKNNYLDDYSSVHLAAVVTNSGDTVLSVGLVAGVYAADGTVLDAAYTSVQIYIGPGESVPVNFDNFYTINGDDDLIAEIDSFTVQFDPYWTYESSSEVEALETANETSENSDGYVTFTGDVVNSSTSDISSATVLLALLDPDGNVYTSGWTGAYPEDGTLSPGETVEFQLSLYLPADLDTSDFTFITFVQGYVQ